jgi:hypothetical protein
MTEHTPRSSPSPSEATIGPSVTVTCAEHLTIRDGEVQADRLTFDPPAAPAIAAGG